MSAEKFATTWAEAEMRLAEALPEVTRLMKERFAQLDGNPELASALDQLGLSNGAEVVSDYMAQNELGVALEHLCYMIEEADLTISEKTYMLLKAVEQAMQMDVLALSRIKPLAK